MGLTSSSPPPSPPIDHFLILFVLKVVVSPLRKKQLMVYALSGDRLQHVRDYPLAEQAVAMVTKH